jgi:hypothetical protein
MTSKKKPKKKVGLRFNNDKLEWNNFPMFLLQPLMEVAQAGAKKYKPYNFLEGMSATTSLNSLKRHIADFENPYESDYDVDKMINGELVKGTGCHHLAMAAWNCLVCVWCILTRPELDDRWSGLEIDKKGYKKTPSKIDPSI